jgi:hypothetical protein
MDTQDANVSDSSPEQEQVVQTESTPVEHVEATTKEAVQQEETPFHNHPRFQELIEKVREEKAEKEFYKQQIANLTQRNTPVIEEDEDKNLDPQTRVFYQDLDKRVERKARKLVDSQVEQIKPVVNALMQENAKLREKLFRNEHSDVPRGSVEEQKIAKLIAMGVSEDEAAWAIMGPKRAQVAQQKVQEKKVISTQVKQQANLENSSVPKTNGLPPSQKVSFRDALKRSMNEAGF